MFGWIGDDDDDDAGGGKRMENSLTFETDGNLYAVAGTYQRRKG